MPRFRAGDLTSKEKLFKVTEKVYIVTKVVVTNSMNVNGLNWWILLHVNENSACLIKSWSSRIGIS